MNGNNSLNIGTRRLPCPTWWAVFSDRTGIYCFCQWVSDHFNSKISLKHRRALTITNRRLGQSDGALSPFNHTTVPLYPFLHGSFSNSAFGMKPRRLSGAILAARLPGCGVGWLSKKCCRWCPPIEELPHSKCENLDQANCPERNFRIPQKRHTVDQIVAKLRQPDMKLGKGKRCPRSASC